MKTGGENVSSLRVEAVLAQHPDVAKTAVIGLPRPRWSEAVTAVVVLRDGAAASEEDLIKHCRASLAGYETPSRWCSPPTCPRPWEARCSSTGCAPSTPVTTAT